MKFQLQDRWARLFEDFRRGICLLSEHPRLSRRILRVRIVHRIALWIALFSGVYWIIDPSLCAVGGAVVFTNRSSNLGRACFVTK